MACDQQTYNQSGFYTGNDCVGCAGGLPSNCTGSFDASCGIYTGPELLCLGAVSPISIENLFQLVNNKVCSVIGDFTSYNLACLTPVDSEQEFVEQISQYVCNNKDLYDTFVGTTFPAYINATQLQIDALRVPGTASGCSNINIPEFSTQSAILQILVNTGCSLYAAIDPSSANWSQCFSVGTAPTTIVGAFNIVLDQICQVKSTSSNGALPLFNNTGSCLPSPGATDTLVSTITKIKTRLCQSPTFAASNLTSNACIGFTTSSTLEQVINLQNTYMTAVGQSAIRDISSDFTLALIDPMLPCLGKKIILNTGILDRKVASNSSDSTPGTLQDKLQAGTNVSFDYSTTPGKVIVNATGGASSDEKVKINFSDPTTGYLQDKLIGGGSGYITTAVTTSSSSVLQVLATLDLDTLMDAILGLLETDDDLKTRFCAIVSSCPVVCEPPTSGSVTFQ